MITLYPDQIDIVHKITKAMLKNHRVILVQSPTGSGKTIIFTHIVSEMKKKNKRALIVTDRDELLHETGNTLKKFGLSPYYIQEGQMVEPPAQFQIYVAMGQTLRRRIEIWKSFWNWFDLVIFDECHKQEFNPYFENECFKCRILGFTATPLRSGKQRQLSEDYEVMIEGLQVPKLVKLGRLVKDRYYGIQAAELDHPKYNSKGDYAESWMFDKFNKTELYAGVVENWVKICPNTATLVFCVNIQHVIKTCEKFNDYGIKAKFIVSDVARPIPPGNEASEGDIVKYERKLSDYETYCEAYKKYSGNRQHVIQQWEKNEFWVLVNCGMLTTGFNRQDLECVITDRATTSMPLLLQMWGRGSRTFDGLRKDGIYLKKEFFYILDFGCNAERLGHYNQMRQWSLVHSNKEGGGAIPVKECGKGGADERGNCGCGAYVFVSLEVCECGYIFKKEKPEKVIELKEINYTAEIFPEKDLNGYFKELERVAESRGYKQGWVIPQIIMKHGKEGIEKYGKFKGYLNGWYWQTVQRYAKIISDYEAKQELITEAKIVI